MPFHQCSLLVSTLLLSTPLLAQDAPKPAAQTFDPQLAQQLGADSRGMRQYVLVVLKTGPKKVPAGKERDEMFAGHFANMQRLSDAGKLALAGPFDGKEGWRGLFIFAVNNIDEARELTATDPVIMQGEMVAEFHPWYGSAAVMEIPKIHPKLVEKK
ncbi:hypothetical protein H8K35_00565 [Undibacterium sp. LX40W]|uniref:YCII-related domain-containing protein n=1 Tax=Undibacterium nitidum TaxID=2762298 RepID=A0A923HNT5_9BURK|nr:MULTISPECIES: YciI family protein [Undibacterium]MBC3881123.1 hypothetical protein [Undibacterium nitidum]MBC3890144.1 hypothetical protein [Undibacterium sp. LX40W]